MNCCFSPQVRRYNRPNSIQILVSALKKELQLHEAVIKNDTDAVRRVLKEQLDVNSRNNVSTHHRPQAFPNSDKSNACSNNNKHNTCGYFPLTQLLTS